ncbi:unnamed protein product [Commensalibacter communis]|uniref:Uncharacterized protein n=1 Tax=Commensalibacter communis TaxID=2972786 RepID=A0A9W4X758_9PROT|nr:hypothetical protein [Commensalibacter communis]CAI3950627.1 unnamed protein product [Commensalibacter communis]CAI3952459.1 unnamed protein product [Commensalibacter communis]CAI3954713.1 unnamed protein product [Commensalibacter communis]CAI3955047.1 unnamed protein product [Commensalibacter communis]
MAITVTISGANGNVINLDSDVTKRDESAVTQLQNDINNGIATGKAQAFDIGTASGNPDVPTGVTPVGIITEAGMYQLPSAYDYIVVADGTDAQSGSVVLNNNGFNNNFVDVLAGRKSGIVYNAGNESGQIVNTSGNLSFNGADQTGAWTIYTGNGDATIATTNGNNRINTGTGKNTIQLGTGVNSLYLQGEDTITGASNYQSVTVNGSNSDITLGDGALVLDGGNGSKNKLSIGKDSTITGGVDGQVTFNNGGQNTYQGGTDSTINASGADAYVRVVHGDGNTYAIDGKATFLNSFNKTSITISGEMAAFGAQGSDYTVNASGNSTGLFVADIGNETLNASGSTVGLSIYANTVSGATSNFVATGGSGNDVMVGGTGNSTFTGGAGDNYFMFDKNNSENGNTVIKDFAHAGSSNKIAIYNFGLDTNSLAELLHNSQNDAQGSAVLNLNGHSITVEGVSVADLTVNQFDVGNPSVKTA